MTAVADVSRVVQYRIIQSALPITDYVSSIKVQSTYEGSHVVWSSTFRWTPGRARKTRRG